MREILAWYFLLIIDDGQVMETNNFILRLESLESFYNELHVRVINVFSRIDGKSRRIWHCHFQGWPDYQKSNCVNVLTVIDLMNYLITRSEYEQCQGIPSGNISFLQNQRFGRSDIDLRAFLNSVQGEEFNGECTINNDVDDEMLRVTTRDMAIDQDATISSPVHVKRESIPSQLHSKSLFSIQLTKESSFVAAKRYVGPPILHCSAGCGRTGTMITIDTICRMLLFSTQEDIEYDLVFAVVDYLREQRVSMVQSLDQFAFCYEAILTWIAERRKRGLKDTWAAEI